MASSKRDRKARQVEREKTLPPTFATRRYVVLGMFWIAALALVARAFDQQILHKDFLQSRGADRYLDKVVLPAQRGIITDRRGEVLALTTPVYSVVANPHVLTADAVGLAALAEALGISLRDLRNKLKRNAHSYFTYLKTRMAPSEAHYVLEVARLNKLKGLSLEKGVRRYYPTAEVFSQVVGFTDYQDQGQEGLEREYNRELKGEPGKMLVVRDGRGRIIDDVENIRAPHDGKNLALSLDGRLQFLAYRALKEAVIRNRAVAGSAVLLDVQTGEVLAMVNQPAFNPNGNRSPKGGRLRNRAITDEFQPGSTMKPFVVAAALQQGTVKPDSLIDTSPGYMKVKGGTVRDHDDLKTISLETLLGKSSNVGAAKLALSMAPQTYWTLLHDFGFGEPTDTGFPGESAGRLRPWQSWAQIDQATLAFGYSISVTTLQLARAYAVIANNGVELPVSLLKVDHPPQGHRVISAKTAEEVRTLLEAVTAPGGTAPNAAIPGYRVAGKTGTAKEWDNQQGYEGDRYRALFAGMAPLKHPRLVMVVEIDRPRGVHFYGGQVAAPVFAKVMSEALRLLNVPPDALSRPRPHLTRLATVHTGEGR